MRPAPLLGAASVLALAWAVLPASGLPPFTGHMLGHVLVVAVAAPLLALAVAGGRLDPVPRAPRLLGAFVASMLELVAVWAWHAPALHHAARHATGAFVAEQATFLGTGFLLWIAAIGGGPALREERALQGIGGLLFTSMHMTLLGALLGLAERPLYGHGTVLDQQVGGALMLLVGGASYLLGAVGLVARLLRPVAP